MYPHLFLAGTFDGMHAGHRRLLTEAFRVGERVTIGLTSDGFVARFKTQKEIKRYTDRKRSLTLWLKNNKFTDRATIIPIDNPYEPAASMKDLDALIVTRENRKTGERINALRYALGVPQLTLIEVPMVAAHDGRPISSTRVRNGEIDNNGRLVMPESMRTILGKPLGTVLKGVAITASIESSLKKVIITVGDVATKTLLDAGITPTLSIIDGMVGRKPFPEVVYRLKGATVVKSGPGYISREAVEAIKDATHHAIVIDGEEDLLVLPAILHAPLGSVLYYGQPNEGLVEVIVTEQKKQQVLALLGKFT